MGDWSSLAVLSYLVTNFDRKLEIERVAAAEIAKNGNTNPLIVV